MQEQKKEIIRNGYIKLVNQEDPSANCTTFQDVLDWAKKRGAISEATEDAFWTLLLSEQGLDENLIAILKLEYFNKSTKMIEGYTVTNPANATSNEYIATENGTYTFKIQDIVTGKTYTKKVEVTNVDTSLPSLTVVGEKVEHSSVLITLKVATADKYTKFEKAYIMYNNEKIEITSIISNDDKGISYISTVKIAILLKNKKIITSREVLNNTDQTIILVKDNKEYTGTINMGEVGEA